MAVKFSIQGRADRTVSYASWPGNRESGITPQNMLQWGHAQPVLTSAKLASSLSLVSVSLAKEVRVRIPRMVAVSLSTCSVIMVSRQLGGGVKVQQSFQSGCGQPYLVCFCKSRSISLALSGFFSSRSLSKQGAKMIARLLGPILLICSCCATLNNAPHVR